VTDDGVRKWLVTKVAPKKSEQGSADQPPDRRHSSRIPATRSGSKSRDLGIRVFGMDVFFFSFSTWL
jgi:hypothetical protein